MLTKEDFSPMDFGLPVTLENGVYTILVSDHIKEYPIGGLISEYSRLAPYTIKNVIMSCDSMQCEITDENIGAAYMEFHKKLYENYPPVTATMISLEFQNALSDWFTAIKEDRVNELKELYDHKNNDIMDFIFKNTPYSEVGCSTILQVILSAYASFADSYIVTKYTLNNILDINTTDKDQQQNVIETCSEMYGDLVSVQHIDYRIYALETGLTPIYTIKSSLSLLLFDMAHVIKNNVTFHLCPNCNQMFVPEGRKDTVYCSYPSPQNKDKSCREIGAQIARANKEKTDILTSEYRKAYMRHKMMTKRHPYDREKRNRFDSLTAGMKEWRVKLADGTATSEQFLSWLEQYK